MFKLFFETAMLAAESQQVIAMRLVKLARGDGAAQVEAHRMVAEKLVAATEAAGAIALGASPADIVRDFRRRVSANKRRLRGEGA